MYAIRSYYGYAYIIARNSSGIINAYKACTKIESEIYINPTFEFGENETTPIIGRIEHLGEYTTSTINHELWLKNIGLNNVTRVLVDGVTKYEENGVIVVITSYSIHYTKLYDNI